MIVDAQNKSVVIWLKTCQLHLKESLDFFVSLLLKTQGTAELLLAIPFKEKPNFTKILSYNCNNKFIAQAQEADEKFHWQVMDGLTFMKLL
jgi:hypothetical protein